MPIEQILASFLIAHQVPAIFFSSMIFGDAVIMTAAFLSGQGIWSPITVFILTFFGTLVADIFWFFLGRKSLTKFHKWEAYRKKSEKILAVIEKIAGSRPLLFLFITKFLYGTRIITIVYVSLRNINFFKFIAVDSFGTLLWLFVIVPVSWFIGKSTVGLSELIGVTKIALIFLLFVFLITRIITLYLKRSLSYSAPQKIHDK